VVTGPAIVTQTNSTTVIPKGYTATVMRLGDIVISRNGKES
jgi:N-methylhydantoinase A/oxoprolinase/acetone carboxylase beta subunit